MEVLGFELLSVPDHRPQLIHFEAPPALAGPHLIEENGPAGIQLDPDTAQDQDRQREGQSRNADGYVDEPLHPLIGCLIEQGTSASHIPGLSGQQVGEAIGHASFSKRAAFLRGAVGHR